MRSLRFLRLCLLSRNERAGLEISFGNQPTLIRAPNNHGKSAILKSLYDTFGAQPHKIDGSWKQANVTSLIEFSLDGQSYAILKTGTSHSIFDNNKNLLLSTNKISDELAPFLADLFNFRLVMADQKDQVRIPPPAYIFSPFYVDQDQGWTKAWSSFARMYLPNSSRILSEYHSGIRPNEYYVASAERERLRGLIQTAEAERKALSDAIKKVRDSTSGITLTYDLANFAQETGRLVAESQHLHEAQASYRDRLARLNEELQLWNEQKGILNGALAEMNDAFSIASSHPGHVECPTCGQEYENSLREQFGLVEDLDGLLAARINALAKISALDEQIKGVRSDLFEIEDGLSRVQAIFSVRKAEVTFRDVVAAEGKTEAARLLQTRLDELDKEIGKLSAQIDEQADKIEQVEDRDRAKRIKNEFIDLLTEFSKTLDVRLEDRKKLTLNGVNIARGSEGPRALLAYYFAFLRISQAYSSAVFCPIVIDAPNQQGQDHTHMPAMMRFMIDEAPQGAQLIIAAEDQFGLTDDDAETIDVSGTKDHVLRQDQFESVNAVIRPYLELLT
ncbi:MAG: hypothetical protein OJF48_000122 [Afipia sp.]|jgi:predicted  nucleic acid-binding Zn-ribbon protein|nr:MAG: hypothetical protein OJF48_000122 [Afipia sp.]